MKRKPMTVEQAAQHARRVIDETSKRYNPRAIHNDDEAFQRIKASGQVMSLARELHKALKLED